MKKLFLIPLLACFFCIGAWSAQEINVGTEADLRTVLDTVTVETRINLTHDIHGEDGFFLVKEGSSIILNLSSSTLTANYYEENYINGIDESSTVVNKGTLKVITEGDGMLVGAIGDSMWGSGKEAGFAISNHGTLTINGGMFRCDNVGYNYGLNLWNPLVFGLDGTITINGGYYLSGAGGSFWQGMIRASGGKESLVINGGKFSANTISGDDGNKIEDYMCDECAVENISNLYWVAPAGTESITENTTIDEENNKQEAVFVTANTTLTVPEGQTLTITKDLAFKDATSQLVVNKGARVIVGNEIVTASTENIALTIDDKNKDYSNLLVAAGELQESHPKATVTFNTKARRNADTHKLIWQRFAVPSHTTFNIDDLINVYGFETCVEGWDYENDCWKIVNSGEDLEPFQMYALAINNEIDPATQTAQYNFPCELVGNGNPELTIREGWNYFANAYTAPMNLMAWLVDLLNDPEFAGVIDGTIYVQKLQESNAWGSVTAKRAMQGKFGSLSEELQPMQAFIYHATANTTIPLKYKEYVYDPLVTPAGAPARKEAQEEEYTEATIIVTPAVGEADYLYVYEGADFSEAFDNGVDATKFMNEDVLNAYFETVIGDLSDYATNDLNNAALTIKTAEESEITISFEDVTLENYFLVDSETETKTEIKSGNSYVFVGAANTTYSQRFSIVKDEEPDPSAVENVEASQKKNGIYTLTGQYMGNILNALPKGVYIINGQKVVR